MKNILFSAVLFAAVSAPSFAYQFIDLGANVEPKAINNYGVVVGSSNTNQYPTTAFRWFSGSRMETIEGISANDINDAGHVAGSTLTGAFTLNDAGYQNWNAYGAYGINADGTIAGTSIGTNPYQPRSLPYNPAVLSGTDWTVFDIAELYPRGTREGVYADRYVLTGINDSGYAVGIKYRYGLTGSAAILVEPDARIRKSPDITYLDIPAGGKAVDINNQQMIAGTTGSDTTTVPVRYSRAYMLDYTNSTLTILPTLEGGQRSTAKDINNANLVVGDSEIVIGASVFTHAFVWNPADGVTVDLNDWAPAGWILTSATAINDNGDIVGTGTLNGVGHGFLLSTGSRYTPVPAENLAPVAAASADVYRGKAPLTVNFNSLGTSDADGMLVDYIWDFMDGVTSTDVHPTHTFTEAGSYPVTLTVTDNEGARSTISIGVVVRKDKRN